MKMINNNSSLNKILIFSTLIAASWTPQNVFADVMTPTVTAVITPCDDNDPLCNGGGGGGATPTPCPFVTVTPVETAVARASNDVITNKDQFNDPDGDPCGGGGGATPTPIGTVTKTPCPTLAIDKFGNPIIPADLSEECGGGGGTVTPTPTSDGGGGTVTPTPTSDGGGGTVTPTPTSDGGGGTVTPTPTGNGNGTVTPTPTGNGNGTVTPTPTGNGNGTVTPTPTGNGGNGTATPTPTSNGGGNGTATPTPTVGGFDSGGTGDYNVPPGCRVEVPYYKLKAILTTLDQYFGRRGYGRVTSLQKIHLDEVNNTQKSKLKKDFGKRNQNFKNLLGSARAALLPIPGVMVQCNEPPASCSKIEHPGLNVFEAQLKIVEQEMQANYKNALKGIAKKPRVLLFMRKEGSGAVKYMPRIAKKTKEASLALSGQISRSSFICR